MSGIRGKNTKPEILIRKALFARGFRYRLHGKGLPGKPDIVLARLRAVIFVHGCFWHGHDCRFFKWPATRPAFWRKKIARNQENDEKAIKDLQRAGWRTGIVWECAVRSASENLKDLSARVSEWLNSNRLFIEMKGSNRTGRSKDTT